MGRSARAPEVSNDLSVGTARLEQRCRKEHHGSLVLSGADRAFGSTLVKRTGWKLALNVCLFHNVHQAWWAIQEASF